MVGKVFNFVVFIFFNLVGFCSKLKMINLVKIAIKRNDTDTKKKL